MTCCSCQKLVSDPVMLTCGHNICHDCFDRSGYNKEREQPTCPECKKLADEVFCTYCIQAPVLAVKTCPTCDASFCNIHLNGHSKSGKHMLIEPTMSLVNRKCSFHGEVLNYYCTEDNSFICASCWHIGKHKKHPVELLSEASENKKEKLRNVVKKRHSRKRKTEERIENLRNQMSNVKDKANNITNNLAMVFKYTREQMEALERRILREVSRQEEQVLQSISKRIQELETKRDTLSKHISYNEELCKVTDPWVVLQGQKFDNSNTCLALEVNSRRLSGESFHTLCNLDDILISMTLHRNLAKIVNNVRSMKEFHVPEVPDMLLDVNTAGDYVIVSGDLKTTCKSEINQRRPEKTERFYCGQVLSNKHFASGRFAWEVETSNCGDWMIGVAYPSIERKGPLSFIGINNMSWCLQKMSNKYSVKHSSTEQAINPESSCQNFLVFMDYEAGQLSFYQLSDPINHLHTFTATFTEPLHAGFMVGENAWVRIKS